MSTHILFTVGTNPLPVLVSFEHLKSRVGGVARVTLIHTGNRPGEGSYDEKERLSKRLSETGVTVGALEVGGTPLAISKSIEAHSNNISANCAAIHLNYTSGTKAMAVHALGVLKQVAVNANLPCTSSYLDPRPSTGPTLVDDTDHWIGQVSDARIGVTLSLTELAALHGYDVAPFAVNPGPFVAPAENPPTTAALMLFEIQSDKRPFERLNRYAGVNWRGRKGDLKPPGRPEDFKRPWTVPPMHFILPCSGLATQRGDLWPPVAAAINTDFCGGKKAFRENGSFVLPLDDGSALTAREYQNVARLLGNSGALEVAAFHHLRAALGAVKARNSQRGAYSLYWSAVLRPTGRVSATPFEFDVVAILGYQIVVVSCAATAASSEIKRKAFEALHRARQLGGDEARAIVLAALFNNEDRMVQEDVEVDIGSRDCPLQVWGRSRWRNLTAAFQQHLDGLGWR